MRNIYVLLAAIHLLWITSCTDDNFYLADSNNQNLNSKVSSAGDGVYDVLGMGYDVTGEYLHPLSVKNPVLNIKKYENDFANRLVIGTPSFGYDEFYAGATSEDYIKTVTKDKKVSFGLGYPSDAEEKNKLFSGTISYNPYFQSTYSYSTKYSFASVDAIRNYKYIRINDDISRLSNYLSDEFIEDLNRYTPDKIVELYGTHVLTDFTIGGRYKLMFRSSIVSEKDSEIKKKAVEAGLNFTLFKIGFKLNYNSNTETSESLAKINDNKELYVLFYGGKGTNMKYDLEKGMPTNVDIAGWENTVSLSNANLTNINWQQTYPIYDFITDPIKKGEIRNAVERYIKSKQLMLLDLTPLYKMKSTVDGNHYYTISTTIPIGELDPGKYRNEGPECYVFKTQQQGTVPLYKMKSIVDGKQYYTISTSIPVGGLDPGKYKNEGPECYVYKTRELDTVPLYKMKSIVDGRHYYTAWTTVPVGGLDPSKYKNEGAECYVYPVK